MHPYRLRMALIIGCTCLWVLGWALLLVKWNTL
jgi:hypothetical protein